MSVLNKMLRDLEQRQPHTTTAVKAIPVGAGQRKTLMAILLLSCLLLLATYFVQPNAKVSEPVTLPENSAVTGGSADPVSAKPVIQQPETPVRRESLVATTTEEKAASLDEDTTVTDREPIKQAGISAVIKQTSEPRRNKAENQDKGEISTRATLEVVRSQPTIAQQVDALSQQAVAAAQAGQLQRALQLWQQVQQLQPEVATAYLAQARLWLQLGQPAQAEQVLQLGLQHGIVNAQMQFLLAQQAASKAEWHQVERLLSAQFELPQHTEYYGLKATALQQLGQQQAALYWYQQLLQVQPQQARWWLGAALAFDELQQWDAAKQHYRQALQWGDNLSSASRQFIQQRLAAIE